MLATILFVCSANKDRSRTAEDHFAQQFPAIQFDSAGTNHKSCEKLGTTYLEVEQLQAADRIYVMETKHLTAIKERFGSVYYKKVTVLHIKDHYRYGDKVLLGLLESKIDLSRT